MELKIEDARKRVSDFDLFIARRLSPLYEFFQFGCYPRNFTNPNALADCSFFDLYISYYVRDWPEQPGPPHSGLFEEFFPIILGNLIGPENSLTLFVKGVTRDHCDELEVIDKFLAPRNLRYILLPSPPPLQPDPSIRLGVGNLIFEWPVESLEYVVEHWFYTPCIEIEGYISREPPLARIAQLYFQPDTEERVREILRSILIGFRVWTDTNGLFLLTDKLHIDALRQRIRASELNPLLEEAAKRYDAEQ